jgi:predicted ATPase
MLYAISGSQGSGKTTLLELLKQLGYRTVERKTSRSILQDWNVSLSEVNNNHELTIKFQDEILKRKFEDEKQYIESKEIVFTERTVVDLWVYSLIALGKDNQYSDWLNNYYAQCLAIQRLYAGVFYLTAGHFAPEADGVRGINVHYSKMVDLLMAHYIQSMTQRNLVFIETPNLDSRVEMIIREIENKQI